MIIMSLWTRLLHKKIYKFNRLVENIFSTIQNRQLTAKKSMIQSAHCLLYTGDIAPWALRHFVKI